MLKTFACQGLHDFINTFVWNRFFKNLLHILLHLVFLFFNSHLFFSNSGFDYLFVLLENNDLLSRNVWALIWFGFSNTIFNIFKIVTIAVEESFSQSYSSRDSFFLTFDNISYSIKSSSKKSDSISSTSIFFPITTCLYVWMELPVTA
jgi:hypothetical protein